MTESAIILQEISLLRSELVQLARAMGPRLTREQLCNRRGCHRNTIPALIERGVLPRPDVQGKFLLSEVIEYETMERRRA